jgi:hypothetical protein
MNRTLSRRRSSLQEAAEIEVVDWLQNGKNEHDNNDVYCTCINELIRCDLFLQ